MTAENTNQTIERLTQQSQVVYIDQKPYSTLKMTPVFDDRIVRPINLKTLTGFIDYINSKIDDISIPDMICTVDAGVYCELISAINIITKNRDKFVTASVSSDIQNFGFNDFIGHEEFCIKLKSMFVETQDQLKLLAYVSKLSIENNVQVHDDGVTQSATIKKGMSGALKAQEVAPVTVKLRPYRTFNEIEQPETTFLFRMRQSSSSPTPTCALFDADGGAWRQIASQSIKKYIEAQIKDLTVVA